MNPTIIIPAYKPEQALISLVNQLRAYDYPIIIVNDGSEIAFLPIFTQLEKIIGVKVLHHYVNLGKGQALKTAFNHYLLNSPIDSLGVITADADGQHLAEDIHAVANKLKQDSTCLWLGARTFSENVPWRSRFGNNVTRLVFRSLIGQNLQDTQTGLRGIGRVFLTKLLRTTSVGYDFELDMLVLAAGQKLNIQEAPIQTVYTNANKSSHFHPLLDSLKIYFVFIRFLFFSITTGILDFCAFSMAFILFNQVLASECLARIFSGSCNFLLNKGWVFKSKQKIWPEALKYALLCGANLIFSYALISSLVFMGCNVYFSKLLALAGLFIANFAIQKVLIFNRNEEPLSNKFS